MQRSIAEPAFLTDTRELPVVARPCAVAPPNMVATSHAGVRWSCLRLGHDVLLALGDERFELPHAFPTEMQQRVKVFRREISKPLRHASLKRQGATVLRMRRCCGVFTDRREAAQCIFGERTRNGGENGHHCAGGNSRKMTAKLPVEHGEPGMVGKTATTARAGTRENDRKAPFCYVIVFLLRGEALHARYVFCTKATGCLQMGQGSSPRRSAQLRHATTCPHGTRQVSMSFW